VRGTGVLLRALAGLLALSGTLARADEPPSTAGAAPAVEELTVTTRRREESLQDVPVAVTVLDEERLEAVSPSTLRDLDALAPNLFIGTVSGGPGMGAIFLRGQGYADIEKTQSPAVGLVVDDVFLGTNTGQLIDLFDVEQVEIARGPQSVLYGRNTTGGTIVVHRRGPDLERARGRAEAGWGDFSGRGEGLSWDLRGALNVPLVESALAVRGGWISKGGSGTWTNAVTGGDEGDPEYRAARLQALAEPGEHLSILLSWDWIEDRSDQPPQDPRFDGDDPFVTRADRRDEIARLDLQLYSARVAAELPHGLGTLHSVTAYLTSEDLALQDFDGAQRSDPNYPFALLHTRREQEYSQLSQELRYERSFFGDRVELLLGGLLWRSDLDFRQDTQQLAQLAGPLLGLPPFVAGTCRAIGASLGERWREGATSPALGPMCLLPSAPATQLSGQSTEHWAVFGSATARLTDSVSLTIGARQLADETSFETALHDTRTLRPLVARFEADDRWHALLGLAQLDWRPSEEALLYASWTEGFRSGGFSIRGVDPARLSFDPESLDQAELGAKTRWLDGRAVANVAAYYAITEGRQFSSILTTPGAPPGTNTILLNHDETETYGAELEVSLQVAPRLRLYGSFGWQRGEVVSSHQAGPAVGVGPDCVRGTGDDGLAGPPGCRVSLAGLGLARTPEWNGAAGLAFAQRLGPGELSLDARVKWIDDFFLTAPGVSSAPVREPAVALVDASLAYAWGVEAAGERLDWRLALVGRNLGDREYRENALPLFGDGGFQRWAPPRYLGAEVGVAF
jgi:iron complex outermembrane receptor protein